MMRTCRLEIHGLNQFGDILAANDILSDHISPVFAEGSRRVTPNKTAQLRWELDRRIRAMGVFVKASVEETLELTGHREKERVVDLIQLHGDEDEICIRQLGKCTSFPIIKVVRVRSREQILRAQKLSCDYLFLDTYTKSRYEGSGAQLNWNMMPGSKEPYFLAGGIHLGNIRQATSHGSYCINISSAVGTGGEKSGRKTKEVAQALR